MTPPTLPGLPASVRPVSVAAIPAPPAAEVLQALVNAGLSLSLSASGDSLLLGGPKAARTPVLRRWIAERRPELLDLLRACAALGAAALAEVPPADDTATVDVDPDDVLLAGLYALALAGRLNVGPLPLGKGRSMPDASFWLRAAFDRARRLRDVHGAAWPTDLRGGGPGLVADFAAFVAWFRPVAAAPAPAAPAVAEPHAAPPPAPNSAPVAPVPEPVAAGGAAVPFAGRGSKTPAKADVATLALPLEAAR